MEHNLFLASMHFLNSLGIYSNDQEYSFATRLCSEENKFKEHEIAVACKATDRKSKHALYAKRQIMLKKIVLSVINMDNELGGLYTFYIPMFVDQ